MAEAAEDDEDGEADASNPAGLLAPLSATDPRDAAAALLSLSGVLCRKEQGTKDGKEVGAARPPARAPPARSAHVARMPARTSIGEGAEKRDRGGGVEEKRRGERTGATNKRERKFF